MCEAEQNKSLHVSNFKLQLLQLSSQKSHKKNKSPEKKTTSKNFQQPGFKKILVSWKQTKIFEKTRLENLKC